MIKKLALLMQLAVLLTACSNDMPFEGNDDQQVLVLTTFLDADAGSNRIILAFTGRHNVTYINDATINIYVNDVLTQRIHGTSSEGVYLTNAQFKTGDVVKVEAITSDGAHCAWGEEIVPTPTNIERVLSSRLSESSLSDYRIRTTLIDTAESRSYYRISACAYNEVEGKSAYTGNDTIVSVEGPIFLNAREDVVLTDGRPIPIDSENDDIILSAPDNLYCVFDNSRIQGEYTLLTAGHFTLYHDYDYFSVVGMLTRRYYGHIKLSVITPTMYLYLKALNIYDSNNYDEMLTQPIKMPSNINGGTGILGISCGVTQTVLLHSYQVEWVE